MSLILGIDPGSRKTGFGIISYVRGRSEYVTSGVIRLPSAELPERLKVIYEGVSELVELHCPQELSIRSLSVPPDNSISSSDGFSNSQRMSVIFSLTLNASRAGTRMDGVVCCSANVYSSLSSR